MRRRPLTRAVTWLARACGGFSLLALSGCATPPQTGALPGNLDCRSDADCETGMLCARLLPELTLNALEATSLRDGLFLDLAEDADFPQIRESYPPLGLCVHESITPPTLLTSPPPIEACPPVDGVTPSLQECFRFADSLDVPSQNFDIVFRPPLSRRDLQDFAQYDLTVVAQSPLPLAVFPTATRVSATLSAAPEFDDELLEELRADLILFEYALSDNQQGRLGPRYAEDIRPERAKVLELSPGVYSYVVEPRPLASRARQLPSVTGRATVRSTEAGFDALLNIPYPEEETVLLSGRIEAIVGGVPLPISGAQVHVTGLNLRDETRMRSSTVTTSADGVFQVELINYEWLSEPEALTLTLLDDEHLWELGGGDTLTRIPSIEFTLPSFALGAEGQNVIESAGQQDVYEVNFLFLPPEAILNAQCVSGRYNGPLPDGALIARWQDEESSARWENPLPFCDDVGRSPCDSSGGCSTDERCVSGRCLAICTGDRDCGADESCVSGSCIPVCQSNADCVAGDFCQSGFCQASACSNCVNRATGEFAIQAPAEKFRLRAVELENSNPSIRFPRLISLSPETTCQRFRQPTTDTCTGLGCPCDHDADCTDSWCDPTVNRCSQRCSAPGPLSDDVSGTVTCSETDLPSTDCYVGEYFCSPDSGYFVPSCDSSGCRCIDDTSCLTGEICSEEHGRCLRPCNPQESCLPSEQCPLPGCENAAGVCDSSPCTRSNFFCDGTTCALAEDDRLDEFLGPEISPLFALDDGLCESSSLLGDAPERPDELEPRRVRVRLASEVIENLGGIEELSNAGGSLIFEVSPSATILDALTPLGIPPEILRQTCFIDLDDGHSNCVRTDGQLEQQWELSPGLWQLRLFHSEPARSGLPIARTELSIAFSSSTDLIEVEVGSDSRPPNEGLHLTGGYTYDASGSPVAGARVELFLSGAPANAPPVAVASTDEDGRWLALVPMQALNLSP